MRIIISILTLFMEFSSYLCSFIWSEKINYQISTLYRTFITGLNKKKFKAFGKGSLLGRKSLFLNLKYVSIGSNSSLGTRLTMTCFDIMKAYDQIQHFQPSLTIGDRVSIGDDAHITCICKIVVGNNVLIGKKVLITDNAHGTTEQHMLQIPPAKRPLYSKGPVVIGDNVWVGDKASIMPGVTIGEGAIIGANAVVTKNIPPYTIAVGVPAEIINKEIRQ